MPSAETLWGLGRAVLLGLLLLVLLVWLFENKFYASSLNELNSLYTVPYLRAISLRCARVSDSGLDWRNACSS